MLTILSQNTNDPNALRGYIAMCERFPNSNHKELFKDESALPRREDGSIDPVAIRLSQVSDAFFSPDWRAVMVCDLAELKEVIRPAGLVNAKAPAIQRTLEWLRAQLGEGDNWKLEDALEGLSETKAVEVLASIKGVGVKTATVTLIEAWGADLCPVDTHVHRLVHRLAVVDKTDDRNKTYDRLQKAMPKGTGFSLHHNLLTLGRTICKARKPICEECFLAKLCPSAEEES